MAKAPNWTEKELLLLKEKYPLLGRCEELQILFPDRTLNAIALKANRLGLHVINNIRKGRTKEEYLELVLKEGRYTPLEEYTGSTTPIKHRCNRCEHIWEARPQHILKPGSNCPICSQKLRVLSNETVDEVLNNAGFTRLSKYLGSFDPITLKHNICGHEWSTAYSYIQQGSGCPCCNKGFGYFSKDNLPEVATLYLLDIVLWSGNRFLKVGVTSRSLDLRIKEITYSIGSKLVCNIRALKEVVTTGKKALEIEQKILNLKSSFTPGIVFVGHSETLPENLRTIIENIIDENF